MSSSEPQRESESTCVLSFSKCSLKTRVSRCSHPWVSLNLPLFVSRVVGQQLLVTPQTGDCTCVFVSTSQGYGKCLSGKRLLVLLLLLSHWWFMWSTAKQNGEEHLSHSFLFFFLFLSLGVFSQVAISWCVCVTRCWFTHTAGAPRGNQDPPRKSNKNNTLSVSSENRRRRAAWTQ